MVLNEYIKSNQTIMFPLYVRFFKIMFDTGVIPSELQTRLIVPHYKNKEEIHNVNNDRRITLLSCMGKFFNSILNERLKKHSDVMHVINENQAGFRHGYLS